MPLLTIEGTYGTPTTIDSGLPPANVVGESYECRNTAAAPGALCDHELSFTMTEESSWSAERSMTVGAKIGFKIPLGFTASPELSVEYTNSQSQGKTMGRTIAFSDKCNVPAPTDPQGCVQCNLVVGVSHPTQRVPVAMAMQGTLAFMMFGACECFGKGAAAAAAACPAPGPAARAAP